ncbi:MAG: hypothetical protein H6728_03010 [Myxococcales bacterium]|nr:hypothetical protein [Myxococcales bacterium]MCB9642023.1 hypothetical protein [Myxococcales bacterium]
MHRQRAFAMAKLTLPKTPSSAKKPSRKEHLTSFGAMVAASKKWLWVGLLFLFGTPVYAQTAREYPLDLPNLAPAPSVQSLHQQMQEWYQTVKRGRKGLAKRRLDSLYQLTRDRALYNYIALSHALLAFGDADLRRGQYDDALYFYQQASRFSPKLASVDYRLAWLALQTELTAPHIALNHLSRGLRKEWMDPLQRAYMLQQALLFSVAGLGLLFFLWWIFLLIRSLRTLDFDFREMFPTGVTLQQLRIFTLLLLLMPILMGGGLIEILLLWIAFSWFYQTWSERVISTVGLLCLSLLPLAFLWIGHLATIPGSRIETVYLLNEADQSPAMVLRAEKALLSSPRDADLLWALGVYYKRNNEFQKARTYLKRALRFDRSPGISLDLTNLDFLEREGDAAFRGYRALLNKPEARPQVYYNIGQLLKYGKDTQLLQQGAEYRNAAILGRGGRIADTFNKMLRKQSNRYIMDASFPSTRYERRIFVPRETPFSQQMWSLFARWIPHEFSLWAGGAAALLFWLLLPLGRIFRRGDPCKKCGVIKLLSETADENNMDLPPNAIICGRCIRSFAASEEGAPRRRVQKELAAGRYQQRRSILERILSGLTLGGGHILQERSFKGFFFFLFVSFYAAWWWFSMSSWPHPLTLEMEKTIWPQIGVGGLLLLVWIYVQRDLGRYKR